MTERSYDIAVLGGGSGGYATALRASELGKSVVIVERDLVGGTCLHRGCVPTKAMLHVAETADAVREASTLGVEATLGPIDMARVNAFRDEIVAKKHKGLQGLLSHRGIDVVSGEGRLDGPGRIVVGDDVLTAADVVIATGASSKTIPTIPLGDRVITSEQALRLASLPTKVVILGGGVIGVEFASMWRSLGVDVVIVEALPRLVPAEDEALSKALSRAFRKRGIESSLGVPVAEVAESSDAVTVTLENGTTYSADLLLVAVGRAPATSDFGLAEAGVELDRGFVVTDERLRTTVPHVWAVGDVVHGLQLAHRAFQQGILVAEQIAGQTPVVIADSLIPRVTYSDPELASVGLTEAQARERHGDDAVVSYEYNLAGNARSEIIGTSGIAKVVRVKDGPVVGVHLAGRRVGELITEGQLVVGWEAHPEDIAPFIHTHPTQSEALGEAFLALAGKPLHAL